MKWGKFYCILKSWSVKDNSIFIVRNHCDIKNRRERTRLLVSILNHYKTSFFFYLLVHAYTHKLTLTHIHTHTYINTHETRILLKQNFSDGKSTAFHFFVPSLTFFLFYYYNFCVPCHCVIGSFRKILLKYILVLSYVKLYRNI